MFCFVQCVNDVMKTLQVTQRRVDVQFFIKPAYVFMCDLSTTYISYVDKQYRREANSSLNASCS